MKNTAAVTATAATALLTLALMLLAALGHGLPAAHLLYLGAVGYTAPILTAAARWGVRMDLVLLHTLRWTGLTLAATLLLTVSGTLSASALVKGVLA